MSKLVEKYGAKGLTVIAVNGWDEPKEVVEKFVAEEKLKQTMLLMGGKVGDDVYKVKNYPTSFWIDHRGNIVGREVGFSPEMFPEMEKHAKQLLESRRKAGKG